MSNPSVVVLIAHYNYQKFLKNSIMSAMNQTYKNTSICVVDDRSDNQEEVVSICEECFGNLLEKLTEVNYVVHIYEKGFLILCSENMGPSEARNHGIRAFINNADFFMILDADDEMLPCKIEELIKPMITWDSIGVCYGDYFIKNENGLVRQENKSSFSLSKLYNECIVHSGSLIRKTVLKEIENEYGFYDKRFRVCEDYQLWLRISQNYMIYHVPKYLTIVNDHSQNSTNTVSKEKWVEHWNMLSSSIERY